MLPGREGQAHFCLKGFDRLFAEILGHLDRIDGPVGDQEFEHLIAMVVLDLEGQAVGAVVRGFDFEKALRTIGPEESREVKLRGWALNRSESRQRAYSGTANRVLFLH